MDIETYTKIKKAVKEILGIDLEYYKDQQMRRRLDSWLVRCGAPSWEDYFKRIRTDQDELLRFRNYFTINVSSFFRDAERWRSLRETVITRLLKETLTLRNGSGIRVWSAGCSIGDEPYTLAMILDEMAPNRRHTILATDLDRGALAKAKARGPYTAEDIQNVSAPQCAAYFEPGGPPFYVNEKIAKRIEFREHNMITDRFEGDFDLIVCRNVVIYFTPDTKDMLYKKFHDALREGGVLFVGATEIIPRPQDIGFRTQGISFYVRSS
jgi:chemotaxis protein methyltransferase CheR